ncbi:NfeD family protein [Paracoccus laeviglucosivorans]|uniref:NfeD-like C-terminal, partner-binding n=1 Tax=Paracoccus laeviglucosivorans TaxID=1197861 RepID=A0A521FR28_9RHOB|nr:hypothetical protein [Paracoccus laeviglucosivorans]SMO98667.1 hypothetical protein SAMN06265221_13611 [Paracoccus laeviglucosivorans]
MNGWLWIVAALVLGGLEILLPGWIFLGIALAVGVMGLAILSGLWGAGLPLTLVATAALSGVIWLLLRRIFGTSRGDVRIWTRDINDHK